MINDHAIHSVVLKSLMDNPQAKTALDNALSTYPLYVGKKEYDLIPTREALNEKLLNHYKYREIGFETVGRFLDELKITMCEIMPYYNELFKTVETMADLPNPFDNVDVVETYDEETTNKVESEGGSTATQNGTSEQSATATSSATSTVHATGTDTDKTKKSDTPQGSVANVDNYLSEYSEHVANKTSDTNGTDQSESSNQASGTTTNNETATTTGVSESQGTTKHTFTKKGNQGVNTYAHDMNEFRTSIIDVVEQIITDKRINELFMLVW